MAREIPLTQGKVALVDDEDYPLVATRSWYAKRGTTTYYAYAAIQYGKGRQARSTLKMHRVILGLQSGDPPVDHINHDGLDNRRCNLRISTKALNNANSRKRANCSSEFKGVYWNSDRRLWQAQITIDSKTISLGRYADETEAALAYNAAAVKAFGQHAYINRTEDM